MQSKNMIELSYLLIAIKMQSKDMIESVIKRYDNSQMQSKDMIQSTEMKKFKFPSIFHEKNLNIMKKLYLV